MGQDREIGREELHQLVWSKPTRTVAKEFGYLMVMMIVE
jgi:hypothetical protein